MQRARSSSPVSGLIVNKNFVYISLGRVIVFLIVLQTIATSLFGQISNMALPAQISIYYLPRWLKSTGCFPSPAQISSQYTLNRFAMVVSTPVPALFEPGALLPVYPLPISQIELIFNPEHPQTVFADEELPASLTALKAVTSRSRSLPPPSRAPSTVRSRTPAAIEADEVPPPSRATSTARSRTPAPNEAEEAPPSFRATSTVRFRTPISNGTDDAPPPSGATSTIRFCVPASNNEGDPQLYDGASDSSLTEITDSSSEADSVMSDATDNGMIRKPEGEAGRPARGGYTLDLALSWPSKDFKKLRVSLNYYFIYIM